MELAKEIYEDIVKMLEKARVKAYVKVNSIMVETYWNIGKIIVVEEQKGKKGYGKHLIRELSKRLTERYGKGFTARNLWNFRDFYSKFKKVHALRTQLSWTHFRRLLRIEEKLVRDFYMVVKYKNV